LDKLGLKAVTDGKVSPAPNKDSSQAAGLIEASNTVENQEWQRAVQLAVNPIHLHHNSHLSPRFQLNDVLDSPAMSHVVPPPCCQVWFENKFVVVDASIVPSMKWRHRRANCEPFYAARHKARPSPYTFVLQRPRLSILSSKIFPFFQQLR
jgi:hypothetical protein